MIKGASFDKINTYEYLKSVEIGFIDKLLAKKGDLHRCDNEGKWGTLIRNLTDIRQSTGNHGINFTIELAVHSDSINYRLILGTQLSATGIVPQATYSMTLLSEDGEPKSHIHFDYNYDKNGRDKKPTPHIQSGGRLHGDLKNKEIWDPKLDKPRVLSLPFCTPILWENAFREFPNTPMLKPLTHEHSWWKKTVLWAETAMWIPFFKEAIEGHKTDKAFFSRLYS